MTHPSPRTGLSRVLENPSLIGTGPIALCGNYTAVTEDLRRGVDALVDAGLPVRCLLTPEHGYWGAVQAGESEGDGRDEPTGLPVLDTYQVSSPELDAMLQRTGTEQIVLDLQDIGTRFYTYTWTLFDLLCSAARTGHRVVVLDRPNPLEGRVAGPGLAPSCASFVGRVSIPLQHGLTIGELARWFNAVHVPEHTGTSADLDVITTGGHRDARGDQPWVLPSPNMPAPDTAVLYPATGLLEGTTLSEGRGTTKPFELFGAGWTDARLAAALAEQELPGVLVREAVFAPMFSTCAGQRVHGAQLHLIDRETFDPVRTGHTLLATIADLYPDQQLWREANAGRPPFLDLLWGSPALREGIDAGHSLAQILAVSPATPTPPADALLYSPDTRDPEAPA
ncbi:exo-beta-N-acetylmuramidase NamZ domain-containing protein [Ruania zhangjianzhongii]|uniref:exo-beta-N-acetylmuramidase NamZ family protein n=1 Tax=Ruania zhangjianzhongii TaxID=2603206 RepID=UPI0011C83C7B|nr:DUF1343 domain-containing protein [Ruania zhangjianzhongii]